MNDRPDPLADLLADHDAGLPVDPSVLTDPRARSVLDALAATRAELAAVPPVPVPPEFAARWSAALSNPPRVDRSGTPDVPIGHGPRFPDAEPEGTADAGGPPRTGRSLPAPPRAAAPDAGRRARRRPPGPPGGPTRRRRPRPAVVAGLVLVVAVVVAGVIGVRPAPPSVTAAQLGGVALAAVGVPDAGPFTDPGRREACLRAVGPFDIAPDAELAGGRSVVFEGRPGVLLLLITGKLAVFRVVVVTPDCDARLATTVVGP